MLDDVSPSALANMTLAMATDEFCATGVVTPSVSGVAIRLEATDAVLAIDPAFTFVWVTV